MTQVRIKQKGQVTIPAALRKQMGMKEGDWLEALIRDGNIVLVPKQAKSRLPYTLPKRGADIAPYIGAAKGVFATPAAVDAFIRAERKRWP
jgi:AbrB family looped-hinge helix DNA binding protein